MVLFSLEDTENRYFVNFLIYKRGRIMEQYAIKGGNPLVGEVEIGGAKNAALPILAASVMTDETVYIDNLPDVRDINVLMRAMQNVGVTPKVSPIRGGTDGARLSFDGLLCPNLCTGSEGHHGRNEFACVEDMEKIVEILKQIVLIYADYEK